MFLCNCQVNFPEMLQNTKKTKFKLVVFPSAELKEIIGFLKAHPLEKWKESFRN